MRRRTPAHTEIKILVRNRHSCCICAKDGLGKEIVIHHIDGNPNNNKPSNLAVLCLMHASMADAGLKRGKLGTGKKLKPDEVSLFKKMWEKKTEIEINSPRKYLPLRERKQLELMYKYEINKIKNEILSLPDDDSQIEKKFSFLEQLVVEEFISGLKIRPILCSAFMDIALQSIDSVNVASRLPRALWHLFMHLIGPDKVKIDKEDIRLFFKSLDILETTGSFAAEFAEDDKALLKISNGFYEFFEIASWYRIKKAKLKVSFHLKKIIKDCDGYESKDKNRQQRVRKKRKQIIQNILNKINNLNF